MIAPLITSDFVLSSFGWKMRGCGLPPKIGATVERSEHVCRNRREWIACL
jgi:hypothetical protein